MTNARALTQVRRDLAAGHQRAALRRLRTMLAANPGDLEIYRLLAEANRAVGNPAEAGRWGFLTGDATDEEIRAFETAHPQPWIRLQLLGWQGGVESLPNASARSRLTDLQHQVTESTVPLHRGAGHTVRQGVGAQDHRTDGLPPTAAGPAGIPVQRSAPEIEHLAGEPAASGAQPAVPAAAQAPGAAPGTTTVGGSAGGPGSPGVPRPRPVGAPGLDVPAPGRALPRPAGQARPARGSLVGRMTRPQAGRRTFAAGLRNYAILAFLIVAGTLGSIGAVGGLRALFGVKNWPAPVRDLIEAIVDLITR